MNPFLFSLFFFEALLGLMMVTTGKFLHLPLGTLIPVPFLTLAPIHGVRFIMAGLALVFKRIQAFFQILHFAFVPLLFPPAEEWWAKALPLYPGSRLIRGVCRRGKAFLPGLGSSFQCFWAR